jgi:hypothetical protein
VKILKVFARALGGERSIGAKFPVYPIRVIWWSFVNDVVSNFMVGSRAEGLMLDWCGRDW